MVEQSHYELIPSSGCWEVEKAFHFSMPRLIFDMPPARAVYSSARSLGDHAKAQKRPQRGSAQNFSHIRFLLARPTSNEITAQMKRYDGPHPRDKILLLGKTETE
jgi:hypothetical protein